MPKPGPRTTYKYSDEFKATAVRLSDLPGVAIRDVAESLYIHPFMLSRWRKQMRGGEIMSKGENKIIADITSDIMNVRQDSFDKVGSGGCSQGRITKTF